MSVVVAAAAATDLDPVTRNWVSAATRYSSFAGPDGERTMVGERWGIGHALLRLPHAHAAQPLTLGNGVWLSADARLDDRTALRAKLQAAGYRAPDADDAELLLRAYATWGERFLDRLAGDFAFVLWDGPQQQLICACDQIGVVPLHYVTLDDQVLVASSPELLLLHPDVPETLDEGAIADFLLTGQAATFGTTAFAAIRRLPAAHVLRWSHAQLSLRRYWQAPEFEPLLRLRRPADYVAHFRHLLELAVGDRIGPGPLATQLSGGMDSTTVTALAHRLRRKTGAEGEMRAVTGVLGGTSGDQEGDYARLVATALGIELQLIDESQIKPTDPLAEPTVLTPEPTPYQWSDIQYQSVCIAAQHARTCLSGLGADPLLRFVPWYWLEWLREGHGLRLAVTFADQARLFRERPHPHLRTSARYLLRARSAPALSIPDWLGGDFASRVDASNRLKFRARPPAWTWDKRALSRDPVWQTWFTWADPSYTRLPLRMNHPFTDLRLLDFAARVPPYPWLVEKQILRDAAEDLLPVTVRRRPKTPLVKAPRPSATPEARRGVAQLVQTVPETELFFDTQALTDAILAPSPGESQDWVLARPIGLLYWLTHWKRPRA